MEFSEKLHELRKSRSLTQEELAEALFVSRTAISKWESGRGYPSIDSLKAIAKHFHVTIDELIGTEEIVTLAEEDKKESVKKYTALLCGVLDCFTVLLLFLPVYGSNAARESFWNVYRPGCSEHYVIHVLRDDPAFIKELDFVMEQDGRLIGQNIFMKTVIEADDGRVIPVLTMGPICITPELKRRGYGKKLLDYSLEKATAMGFGAVLFEGNIGFYGKSGFDYARKFGIRYHDLPEDADDSFFLCRELIPGYLDGISGVYQTPQGYYVDDADVETFDKAFPPKEKLKLPGQLF